MSEPVPFREKAIREAKSIAFATAYFAVCFLALTFIKHLVLAEYGVEFRGISYALVGALVAAKVALILEKVPLGEWVRRRPVAVDTVLRTLIYSVGVAVVLLLEKAFDGRHEHGGFGPAVETIVRTRDVHHILAMTIGVGGALLGFNALLALKGDLGDDYLRRLFFKTTRAELNPHRDSPARPR